jgi:DNA-directed RNA polymerase specialized sigma24 family protein
MKKLTKEEESVYFERYRESRNINILTPVFDALYSDINYMSKKVSIPGYYIEDLNQELMIRAVSLVDDFITSEWFSKLKFTTFIQVRCKYTLYNILRKITKESYGEDITDSNFGVDVYTDDSDDLTVENIGDHSDEFNMSAIEAEQLLLLLAPLYDTLSSDQQYIFTECFLGESTMPEISAHLDLTVDQVRTKYLAIDLQVRRYLKNKHNVEVQERIQKKRKTFSSTQIATIRRLYKEGTYSLRKLGEMFDVTHTSIMNIVRG